MLEQYVLPLNQIDNLRPVAESLSSLLRLPSNTDIAKEFPRTVEYTIGIEEVLQNLTQTREKFTNGDREDYVLFVGKVAVGMSQIALPHYAYLDMDPEYPVLSGYVCNAPEGSRSYRGQGLGRLSMDTRLDAAKQRFGGHAMTMVKHDNVASIGLIRSSGFVLTGSNAISGTYTYDHPR